VALTLVGTLLGVPQWLIALGAFERPDGLVTPLLRVLFVSAAAIGLLAVRRRDVVVR
jgi:putative exporter of polyketide antibiotics